MDRRKCLYFIEESWAWGVCGNRRSNAYELRVEPDCRCSVHKEEECYSPLPRSTPGFSSAFSSSVW